MLDGSQTLRVLPGLLVYAVGSLLSLPYNALTIWSFDGLAFQNHDERKLSLFHNHGLTMFDQIYAVGLYGFPNAKFFPS